MGTQTRNMLDDLKLFGMLSKLDQTTAVSINDSWSNTDFLNALLLAEQNYREQRRIENRIRGSKLKIQPELEEIDYTAKRSITKEKIKELSNLSWAKQGRALLIIGRTGVGKTYLAQALGMHACRNKLSTLFMGVSTFLESDTLARSTGSYLKFRERMGRPEVLIFDDFGLRKFSAIEAQDFCEILEERSIDRSTIITTQLPLKHWKEVITDDVIADAIIDRVKHTSIILDITGDSYREKKGKKFKDELDSKKL